MHVPGKCRAIKKQHNFETYPTHPLLFQWHPHLDTQEGKLESTELAALIAQHFSQNDLTKFFRTTSAKKIFKKFLTLIARNPEWLSDFLDVRGRRWPWFIPKRWRRFRIVDL